MRKTLRKPRRDKQRKQVEESLREAKLALGGQAALLRSGEELLKIVVKNVPAGVAMLDRDMRYLQVSDRFCADYGVDASQVLGRSHYEVFPDIPDRWKEMHRRVLEGETLRAEEDRWDRPGGTTWVRWELRPWKMATGTIGGMLIFSEEITERKLVGEVLGQREMELREAQRIAQLGSWHWDIATDTITWSEEFYRITGRDPRLPAPSFKEHGELFTAESWQRLQRAVERTLQTGEPYELDMEVRRPDGTTRWAIGRGEVEKDAAGHIVCLRSTAQDITERRGAEETRSRLAAIVESAEVAVSSTNLDGVITSWNRGAERMVGYTAEEAIGKPITLVVPPELHDDAKDMLRRLKAGEHIQQYEARRMAKDGRIVEVSMTLSPLKDAEGTIVGTSNIARDITESKRARVAARESEERFRLVANTAPVMIWMSGVDKLCNYFNQPWLDFTGRCLEKEMGNGWSEGVHPEDLTRCLDVYTHAFDRREGFRMEYRLKRRDGEYRWVLDLGVPRFNADGSFAGYIGSCIDVTERKQVEEALSESEEKFRSVYRDAGVGMVIVAPEGRFLAANRTFCDYLGHTEEELLAKTVESVTLPEDWPAFSQKLLAVLTQEGGLQWFQKRCLHKSGRIVYTETSASVIRSRDGKPQYFVGQVLDITRRKEAEEALSEMNRKLVEAQEQERTRIARELHDDINQRLALLSVNLDFLRQDLPSSMADLNRALDEAGKQINEISSDVQDLSHRLHSSKLEYLGLVRAIDSFCRELTDRQKVEIVFHSENVPIELPKDIALPLFRVLQEALQNAIKHSGSRYFEVSLKGETAAIELTVRDSGKGFDAEESMESHGIGLTSMKERLKLVNGKLFIESQPGHGTTILARVPVRSETTSTEAGA